MKEHSAYKFFFSGILLLAIVLIPSFLPEKVEAFTLGTSNKNTLTNGLIGYWSFDSSNITSGRVNDLSGNGYHGNLRNIASTTFYNVGKMGQGLNFDGVDDYVDLGTASRSMLSGANAVTVSAWIKTSKTGRQIILGSYDGGDDGFAAELNNITSGVADTDKINFHNRTNTPGDLKGYSTSDTSPPLSNNSWHHIVYVANLQNNTLAIYYDGISLPVTIAENNIASAFSAFDANIFIGGQSNFGALDQPFRGTIDEVRIYNRELSANEAKQLYNLGQSKLSFGNTNFLTANLKGHWTFDGKDVVGGLIRDISGNNNHAIPFNMASTSFFAQGKIGQGLNFDGVDDYIHIPSTASAIDNLWASGGAISFWVKPDSGGESDAGYWLSKGSRFTFFGRSSHDPGETGVDVSIAWSGGNATWRRNNTTPPISFGKWNHIVFMYDSDSTANDPIIYVNGVNIGSISEAIAPSGTITSDSGTIFAVGSNVATTRASDGTMDDLRMYDRFLTEAEIKSLYLTGLTKLNTTSNNLYAPSGLNSGLINHWTFDGPDFTDKVYDRVGGEHGYIIGGGTTTSKTIGVIGQAGGLTQGSSLYYDFSEVTSIENLNELSVSMWIKATTTSVSTDTTILGNSTNSNQRVFTLTRGTGNLISVTVRTTGNVGSNSGATSIGDKKWHHVGFVYNGSTISVYIDGVQSGVPAAQTGATMDTFGTLKLGNAFTDDLRIYNRALSAAEMKALYNYGK